MRFPAMIGAALLAASTALYAQAPKSEGKSDRQEAREKVRKACEGKEGDERRACVQREVCAQSKDPKACEQRFAKGREAHAKARKACEGKDGEARRRLHAQGAVRAEQGPGEVRGAGQGMDDAQPRQAGGACTRDREKSP